MNCSVSFSVGAEIFVCAQGNGYKILCRPCRKGPPAATDQSRSSLAWYLLFASSPRNFLANLWLKCPFHGIFGWGECRMHHLSISTCAHSELHRVSAREFRLSLLVVSHIRWRAAHYKPKPWGDNKTEEEEKKGIHMGWRKKQLRSIKEFGWGEKWYM